LNNDQIFIGQEIATQQKEAMRKVSNDTARKLSVYIGLVYSGTITIVLFLIDLFKIHVLGKNNNKTNG
jgi:hypothetical protein